MNTRKIKKSVKKILGSKWGRLTPAQAAILEAIKADTLEESAENLANLWLIAIPHNDQNKEEVISIIKDTIIETAPSIAKRKHRQLKRLYNQMSFKQVVKLSVENLTENSLAEYTKHLDIHKHIPIILDAPSKTKGYIDAMFIDVEIAGKLYCERFLDLKRFKRYEIWVKAGEGRTAYRMVRITAKLTELHLINNVAKIVDMIMYFNGWNDAHFYQKEFIKIANV